MLGASAAKMDSQAQLNFLKDLILQSDREEGRILLHRIRWVEEQEHLSRRWTLGIALGIAGFYVVMALATRGWGWLWRQSEHALAVAVLWVVGIALFSLLMVGGCWLWHRCALRRLIADTQRFVTGWLAGGTPRELASRRASGRWPRRTRTASQNCGQRHQASGVTAQVGRRSGCGRRP
jgi:hypothetical protein